MNEDFSDLEGGGGSPMALALALARATAGQASPNPQVGCVLVRDGQIIGQGAHLYAHRDHAEIVALKQAGNAAGATAYVTLEPCSHHGRTGPCADALIAARIARCVVATADPNPYVSGKGISKLRAAGIEVEVGLGQDEARSMNNAFAWSITEKRPLVTLKSGLSVDGRLAPLPEDRQANEPFWLTGPESRAEVQRMRHASDAVLTGIGTVLADDPLLTDRSGLPRRRPLMRVVLDSKLRLPLTSKLVQTAAEDLWIFCAPNADATALEAAGARITRTTRLPEVLANLHAEGILSVLLEAGSTLNKAFLAADLVDEAILFYAETELGPQSLPFAANGPSPFALEQQMLSVSKRAFGADVCVRGLLHDPWASVAGLG